MYENYKEMYADYYYAKELEKNTSEKLENNLRYFNDLIIERDRAREIAATKRLRIVWLITAIITYICFVAIFHSVDIHVFLFFLLPSCLMSAFFVYALLPQLYNWIYLKNVEEAYQIEKLKFHWLVIDKELKRRDTKIAEQILAELSDK